MERNKILDQTASQKTYLEEICQEIEDLNLMHGEEDKLFQRRKLLLEGSRVIETLSKITSLINADNGIEELSGIAQREISRLAMIALKVARLIRFCVKEIPTDVRLLR